MCQQMLGAIAHIMSRAMCAECCVPLLLSRCVTCCSVVQASQGLVNNFVGLTQSLPVIGRRLQDTGGYLNEGLCTARQQRGGGGGTARVGRHACASPQLVACSLTAAATQL